MIKKSPKRVKLSGSVTKVFEHFISGDSDVETDLKYDKLDLRLELTKEKCDLKCA